MTGKRSKGNPDPSRTLAPPAGLAARGTAADGRDDRAGPLDSADACDWRSDADGAGLDDGRRDCNSAARDHNPDTEKTERGIGWPGNIAAVEPLRSPPCLLAGGTRQRQRLRGRLEPDGIGGPHEGRHTGTPSVATAGFWVTFPPYDAHITLFPALLMIGRMIRASTARTMLLASGSCSENYVF